MNLALQLDDDAYAIAKAYSEAQHCSMSTAVSKLVVKSGFARRKDEGGKTRTEVRFPLVHGRRTITTEDVAQLQDEA